MRSVSLLGSTGSIGTQAVDVLQRETERFHVVALAAQTSVDLLLAQAAALRPELVVIGDESLYRTVCAGVPAGTEVAFNVIHGTFGEDGQIQRILEARGIPYTGEGVAGSELAIDKIEFVEDLRGEVAVKRIGLATSADNVIS